MSSTLANYSSGVGTMDAALVGAPVLDTHAAAVGSPILHPLPHPIHTLSEHPSDSLSKLYT